MALNYMVYQYDGSRNTVVMTDMDGKEIVIECDKAEAQVVFDESEDVGILAIRGRGGSNAYLAMDMGKLLWQMMNLMIRK